MITPPPHRVTPFSRQEPSPSKLRRWRIALLTLSLIFAVIALASYGKHTLDTSSPGQGSRIPILRSIGGWLNSIHAPTLAKEERFNILILGQGGMGHEGPFLTDTIVLLSVKPATGDAALISIPRDLAIPIPGTGLRKINEVNAMGEVRDPGKGAAFTADVIGKTFNLPIAAYVRIDFRGFEKIIDAIGGVEIEVARAFTDPNYPDEQGGVISVSFEEGTQTMDGTTALMYVRSRHGSNGEGSDFARAKRQQQLLLAVREKIFRLSTLLNPGKLRTIMNTLESHLSTNIPLGQIDDIYKIAQRTEEKNMHRHVIDASPDGVLREGKDGAGAYVLVPQDGNYATLAQYVHNLLSSEELRNENASLAILNGTNEQGLARAAANDLTALGIQVTVSANAPSRNWHETVLFDLSRGDYPRTLDTLIQKYNARVLTTALPQEISTAAAQGVLRDEHNPQPIDIILILGK